MSVATETYADLTARVAELEAERELTLRLAQTDSLTGLVNRGAFTAELCERLETAQAHGQSMSLFVIDLDRFKHLNDTLGHHAGDAVAYMAGLPPQANVQFLTVTASKMPFIGRG